jgi:hypothetical protein
MIHLRRTDYKTIAFLHLPKTGGMTLIKHLQTHLFKVPLMDVPNSEALLDAPDVIRGAELVAGHYFYPLLNMLDQPAFTMTLLRDPVQRTISSYQFVLRHPTHPLYEKFVAARISSPIEFATDEYFAFHGSNMQTRMLGVDYDFSSLIHGIKTKAIAIEAAKAVVGSAENRPCDAAGLQRAMGRLKSMGFFGLTEHYQASLQLLCRTFNLEVPSEAFMENAAPAEDVARRALVNPGEVEALRDSNHFDEELYRFAMGLFYERCQMHGIAVSRVNRAEAKARLRA